MTDDLKPPKDSKHHYSKKEWAAKLARDEAKKAQLEDANKLAEVLETEIPVDPGVVPEDPFSGLTERQRTIARLVTRGLSQGAIAQVMKVSQPTVSIEISKIREIFANKGSSLDQNVQIGFSLSVFEEVERRAWEIYQTSQVGSPEKVKSLALVLTAREKQNKLLMDLGILRRGATEHTHTVQISPFMERWAKNKEQQQEAVEVIVKSSFTELEEPEPPQLTEDAELIEDDPED